MRSIVVCGVVLLLLTPAFGGDADKDQKALQGKWEGRVKDKEDIELKIDGNKWKLTLKEKADHYFSGTFTVDPKKTPATMDMKVEEQGGEKAQKFEGKTALGIYEIEKDTLRWAANQPGGEDRPTEFTAKGGVLYVEFRRVK